MTKLLPSLKKVFSDYGHSGKESDGTIKVDNALLIVVRNQLFHISTDWSCVKVEISFGGSGGQYAIASAIALGIRNAQTRQEAGAIVEEAIKIAIEFDIYSSGEITVWETFY